ncbi:transcriptional regulator [Micromonospora peucetia]|uniref:Transcriptional regulator n=1 Tax=Micromonospora peucetia TaxID=47871 RepID=A0ABZ1EK22_9ACTN|nr:transcriptional regulator [Micromonospora peucetia]WSA34579.1 transcriptional regulator [Micromonospora peucetia]
MSLLPAVTFAAVAVALHLAHPVADYIVQTPHQSADKDRPGWPGRLACATHVATYTATGAVALTLLWLATGLPLTPDSVGAALTVNAITHYIVDRRTPLRRIARWLRKDPDWIEHGGGLAHLDQAWHKGWIALAALTAAVLA